MSSRWVGTALALWIAGQLVACDTNFVGSDAPLAVDSTSELVAGEGGTLYGQGLNQLTDVTIDGVPVTFQSRSDREATIQVPDGAGEDGCLVEINLNRGPAEYLGAVRVGEDLRLEVGASKVLSAGELRCVQLSSAVQEYVLSVASLTDQAVLDDIMTLRTSGSLPTEPTGVSSSVVSTSPSLEATDEAAGAAMDVAAAAQEFGEPFDNYATAREGDIVELVDWSDLTGIHNATTKEEVPTYEAEVVALEGDQMFLLDLRLSDEDQAVVRENKAGLRAAGVLANRHMVEAVQQTVRRAFTPPEAGAGGRVLTVFTPYHGPAGATVTASEMFAALEWTSGMAVIRAAPTLSRLSAHSLAGLMTHELAHLADSEALAWGDASSHGWYAESLATSSEERFYRLHTGVEHQAGWDGPGAPQIAQTPSDFRPDLPLWESDGPRPPKSAYDRGARILLYAQNLAGDEGFNASGPLLHQELVAMSDINGRLPDGRHVFSLGVIAEHVGIDPIDLLRESWIADLTDDRVPAEAVARFGLPQIDRWDQSQLEDSPFLDVIDRAESMSKRVAVAGGNYAYWFIRGEEGRQVNLEADGVDLQPHHEVRLIRLK